MCHVVAIDVRGNRIAASVTPTGWLLPTAIFPARTPQKIMLVQAAAALPMPVIPRCLAFPHVDRAAESIDYCLIADVAHNSAHGSRGCYPMVDAGTLVAQTALVPYQQVALNLLAKRGDARSLALQPHWLRTVTTWAREAAGLAESAVGSLVKVEVHRATDQLTVAALAVDGRVLHFKADLAEPFVEARVTQLIAAVRPDVVASTRAFDAARGWWLTDHIEGVPLTGDLWPAHLEASEVWTDLQTALRDHHRALQDAGVSLLDGETLLGAALHAASTVDDVDVRSRLATETIHRVQQLLDTCAYKGASAGLLHFDAAPRNIVRSGRGCVFLDLESACLGPSTISGELMARRMKDQLTQAQMTELSISAAAASLRDANAHDIPSPDHVRALTDLCLLAYHRTRLMGNTQRAIDVDSLHFTWQRIAVDFLARTNDWRI